MDETFCEESELLHEINLLCKVFQEEFKDINWLSQKTLTVQLTSFLFCSDSAVLHMWNEQQFNLFGQIQIRFAKQWYLVTVLLLSKSGYWLCKHNNN